MCQDAGSNPLTKPSSFIILAAFGLLFWLGGSGRQHTDKEAVVKTQPMDASLKKWIGLWKKVADVGDMGTKLVLYEEDGMLAGYEICTNLLPLPPYIDHQPLKYLTNIKKVDQDTITYDIVGMKENNWTCPMRKIVWTKEDVFPSVQYRVFRKDGSLISNVEKLTKQ
jgi:hypothetical protein